MFERFVDPCVHLLRKRLSKLSPTSDTNLVVSLMNIVECMTDDFRNNEVNNYTQRGSFCVLQ